MGQHFAEITIDGQKYTIQQFTATKSIRTFTRLSKLLGVPFAMMVKGADGKIEEVLPQAISKLLETADEDEVERMIKILMSCVLFQNQPLWSDTGSTIFETHFQGRLNVLFKLATEVVKFQYKDFLSDLAKFGGVQAQAQAT